MLGLSLPELLGVLLFWWTVWAALFWGSIAIIERHNPYNTFGWALVWSIAELIASFAISFSNIGSLGILLTWLVFLMRLLLGRYELGTLHAVGVVITTVVGPYFVSNAFLAFVGDSETLFMLLLYGVPAAIFVIWLWPRPAPGLPTNLPAARIERFRRKSRPEPQPAAAAPAPAPAPIAAPPLAPVAPPAPIAPLAPPPPLAPAAPKSSLAPSAEAPRAEGEPSFLR